MMKDVNTLDDFDNFARKVILGGQIDPKGPDRTGFSYTRTRRRL